MKTLKINNEALAILAKYKYEKNLKNYSEAIQAMEKKIYWQSNSIEYLEKRLKIYEE